MSNILTPTNEATRREFLGLVAAAGLIAAGCGGADDEGSASKTRTFVDISGQPIEVPDRAERIVATNDQNAGAQLLSLGAPVVGIASRDGVLEPSLARYFDVEGITLVGEHFEPNIELIASLQPDLIVHEGFDGATTLQPATLTALQKIAPVVSIDAFRPIDEVMADYAALIGGGAIASLDQLQAELDDEIGSLRAVLGDRWSEVTASFVITNGAAIEAWGPSTLGASNVLSQVGVTWVPLMLEAEQPENAGWIGEISLERIPEFSADLILIEVSYGGDAMFEHPLFAALPAVAAGQVIEFDSTELTDTHYPGVIAITKYLTEQISARTLRTDLV